MYPGTYIMPINSVPQKEYTHNKKVTTFFEQGTLNLFLLIDEENCLLEISNYSFVQT